MFYAHTIKSIESGILPQFAGVCHNIYCCNFKRDCPKYPVSSFQAQVNVNINCQDFQGETPLVVAAKNNDEPMVEYLLSFENIILGDALLHAVYGGNVKIVEMLLNHQRYLKVFFFRIKSGSHLIVLQKLKLVNV